MRRFILFAFLCSFAFADELTPAPMVRIRLIEKLYSEVTNAELPIGKDLYYANLQIRVDRCVQNENNEKFALLSISDAGTQFYSGWTPVDEYNTFPVQHPRYDVTIFACSVYENVANDKSKK